MSTPAHTLRPTVRDRGARRVLYFFLATVTAVLMLFGYRTSTGASVATGVVAASGSTSSTATTSSSAESPTSTTVAGTTSGTTSSTTSTTSPGSTASGTYTGSSVETRWGPVQVQITVTNGKITAVAAVVVPSDNPRDVQINNAAVPTLNAEAVKAQSAKIDTVSGATVTSDGYISSLQSAIDAAGL